MINYIHSLKITFAMLIAIMTVTIGVGAPISARAADSIDHVVSVDAKKKKEIRKQEEKTLKPQNKSYRKQMKVQAREYERTAAIVAKQGGDPKPLLAAADYFRSQPK